MKKLISMTDFVLTDKYTSTGHKMYAEFLKQSLTLGMFVPCDLDGNVLEEPKRDFEEDEVSERGRCEDAFYEDNNDYQEAKERVLFKGFEFKGESDFSFIFKYKGTFPTMIPKLNIELMSNRYRDIELTKTAQNKINP